MSKGPKAIVLLLAVAVCGLAIAGAFLIDAPVRRAVVEGQGKNWKKSGEFRFHSQVRKLGDWPPLMAAAIAGLLLARGLNSRRWVRILAAAIIASTLAGILANASRLTTGRTRPRESPKIVQGFYGPWKDGKLTIGNPALNSFPSGHTATAFGFALVIVLASPVWGLLALAGAALVAWSSIAMGAHHPSDVVVSIILSFLVAWLVREWVRGSGGPLIDRLLRFPPAGGTNLSQP